jgi:hypothetical protein
MLPILQVPTMTFHILQTVDAFRKPVDSDLPPPPQ